MPPCKITILYHHPPTKVGIKIAKRYYEFIVQTRHCKQIGSKPKFSDKLKENQMKLRILSLSITATGLLLGCNPDPRPANIPGQKAIYR